MIIECPPIYTSHDENVKLQLTQDLVDTNGDIYRTEFYAATLEEAQELEEWMSSMPDESWFEE